MKSKARRKLVHIVRAATATDGKELFACRSGFVKRKRSTVSVYMPVQRGQVTCPGCRKWRDRFVRSGCR